MLKFRFKKVFKLAGIYDPVGFLMTHSFPRTCAYRMIDDKMKELRLQPIEKVCLLVNCTPNDLLEWDPGNLEAGKYALNQLSGLQSYDLSSIAMGIPLEKSGEFARKVLQLRDEYLQSLK